MKRFLGLAIGLFSVIGFRSSVQAINLRRTLLLAGVLAGLVLGTPAGGWTLTYSFTTIEVPGSFNTVAWGINNTGQIVGYFNDATGGHGFLYSGGTFTTINVPGNNVSLTDVRGINDAGQIVGYFRDTTGRDHGFLYSGGSFTVIDVPGSTDSYPLGINNAGQIAGTFYDTAFQVHGFLAAGGSFAIIDVPGSEFTVAYGINNAGQIVGDFSDRITHHGFLYSGGGFTIIDVPDSTHTTAFGINDAGEIVGNYYTDTSSGQPHGFLSSGGSFTTIDPPGSIFALASHINNAGQIVGYFNHITEPGQHGFIASPIPASPVITITATPDTLWPPNGKLVPVTITGTVTDAGSDVDTATYAVTDEYGLIQPSGEVTLDANGNYAFTIRLQASRNGNDADGRQYTITVRTVDDGGNEGSATVIVTVPHDLRQGQGIAAR